MGYEQVNYKQIIKEMTLEEKFHYLTGADMNSGYKLERFPIEKMRYNDGPFGLRMKEKDNSRQEIMGQKIRSAFPNAVKGVAACPKHFVANNQENGRTDLCSEADERTLRKIYLKPFEMMVKESAPWSIMCSYNRLNGVYASEHKKLLNDILREE